ncbi:G5 domain-containing protein [Bacillus sp. 1P10SD]|uniref:G5 domain-containing protein n=1 Tax=Bacillus sp. 1P10SD TaxID=3132265 RepID=UPI0039A6FE68
MNKNQQIIKLFVVLLFGTGFIFSFSYYGAKAFDNSTRTDGKFSNGTTIGNLDVSGKTKEEAIRQLEQKYVDWLKEESIKLQYGEMTASIDLNLFQLDAQQTVDSVKDGQKNAAILTIKKQKVIDQLGSLFPELKSNNLDLDKLTASLNKTASLFETGNQTFNLYNEYLIASQKKDSVLNTTVINLNEIPNELQTFIEKNPAIELKKETAFSLLELAKKHNMKDAYTLDVLATGIYQTVLPTNISVEERNISISLPDYAALGFEAKVNQSRNADLVLVNPNKEKYILEIKLGNKKLLVTLKGLKFAYNYKISTKDEQKLTPKTVVKYSPLLVPGKTMVQTKGINGLLIKVYRDVYQGESFIKREIISEDYYPPTYQVEIHGLAGNEQGTTNDSTTTGTQTTESTTSSVTQTLTTRDRNQPDSNDSDLWGIPNEQPK